MALLTIAVICLIVSLILIVVELLVPSLGTIGFIAAGILVAGGVAAFSEGLMWGAIYVLLTTAGVPLAIRKGMQTLPNTPVGRRVILGGPVTPGHAGAVPADKLRALEHATGTAVTDLRPVGTALLGDARIDVETEADWIDAGTAIEVVRIDGMRIGVRPVTSRSEEPTNA